jgi:hypothetical protein
VNNYERIRHIMLRIKFAFLIFACLYTLYGVEVGDTLIVKSNHHIYNKPQFSDGNEIGQLKQYDTVLIIDKKPKPDLDGGAQNFYKVKTIKNDTGFVVTWVLITCTQKQAIMDTLQYWKKEAQPSMKSLILKTICNDRGIPQEIDYAYPWNYFGPDNKYGVIYADNRYNRLYKYLILAKVNDTCHTIFDIIPINIAHFKPNSQIWFDQCKCVDTTKPFSNIVSIYVHSKDVNKNKLVNPQKAWRPNFNTMKLEEVDQSTVKCGIVDPADQVGP